MNRATLEVDTERVERMAGNGGDIHRNHSRRGRAVELRRGAVRLVL